MKKFPRKPCNSRRWSLAIGLFTILIVSSSSGPARAQGRPRAEVSIILAQADGTQIDLQLLRLPGLRRPPFDQFGSLQLLSRTQITLPENTAQEISLPNGRRLQLTLLEVTDSGRYRIQISINRPGHNDYLPHAQVMASPGDPVFVGGQMFQNGTLVIGIRIVDSNAT